MGAVQEPQLLDLLARQLAIPYIDLIRFRYEKMKFDQVQTNIGFGRDMGYILDDVFGQRRVFGLI